MDRRLEARFDQIDARFERIDARFAKIIRKFNWAIGLVVFSWVTTILAVLYHR